jgi:hypothetical protein
MKLTNRKSAKNATSIVKTHPSSLDHDHDHLKLTCSDSTLLAARRVNTNYITKRQIVSPYDHALVQILPVDTHIQQ